MVLATLHFSCLSVALSGSLSLCDEIWRVRTHLCRPPHFLTFLACKCELLLFATLFSNLAATFELLWLSVFIDLLLCFPFLLCEFQGPFSKIDFSVNHPCRRKGNDDHHLQPVLSFSRAARALPHWPKVPVHRKKMRVGFSISSERQSKARCSDGPKTSPWRLITLCPAVEVPSGRATSHHRWHFIWLPPPAQSQNTPNTEQFFKCPIVWSIFREQLIFCVVLAVVQVTLL